MVAPAALTSEVALSVRPAEMLMPATAFDVLSSVLTPVKLLPLTTSRAEPVLVNVLPSLLSAPMTVNTPAP